MAKTTSLKVIVAIFAQVVASLGQASVPIEKLAPSRTGAASTLTRRVRNAPAPACTPPPEYHDHTHRHLAWTIINSHTHAITTAHQLNAFAAEPLIKDGCELGTIAASSTVYFVAPTGWAGAIEINDARYGISGSDSLIEGSFVDGLGHGYADPAFDVSFVTGFTLPVVCHCGGRFSTGCSLDLFAMNDCPTVGNGGTCPNPQRDADYAAVSVTDFFKPCEGKGFTYPRDYPALVTSEVCKSGITCCIGAGCQSNPDAPVHHKPAKASEAHDAGGSDGGNNEFHGTHGEVGNGKGADESVGYSGGYDYSYDYNFDGDEEAGDWAR